MSTLAQTQPEDQHLVLELTPCPRWCARGPHGLTGLDGSIRRLHLSREVPVNGVTLQVEQCDTVYAGIAVSTDTEQLCVSRTGTDELLARLSLAEADDRTALLLHVAVTVGAER